MAPSVGEFAEQEDRNGRPYLFTVWRDEAAADNPASDIAADVAAWRRELERTGRFVLGAELQGPDSATTLRHAGIHADPGAAPSRHDGAFVDGAAFVAGIEVIRADGREAALVIASSHPRARTDAIEVEAFYVQGDYDDDPPS